MTSPNPLWTLIQEYMDDPQHRYPPRPADLARETDVSDQVISKWKSKPTLPSADQLFKFAKGTGMDYMQLLEAALMGKGYLPLGGEARIKMHGRVHTLEFATDLDEALDALPDEREDPLPIRGRSTGMAARRDDQK